MRLARDVVVLGLAALSLGACADAHLRKPQIGLPSAFETPSGAADASLSPASLDRWWTLFPDEQLHQLVEQALASAPTALTALARLDEAGATRRSRLDTFLPAGNLQGNAVDQHTTITGVPGGFPTGGGGGGFLVGGATQTYSLAFNPSWELDVFGRSRAGARGVNADFAATRFNVEASRMSLAAQVAQGLFQARALAMQLDDAQETRRIRAETARVGRIRAERGLGPQSDSARFQADLDSAEAEVARLTAALAASKRTLLVLLGRGADPLESLPIEARADAPPPVPASAPGELLARRPDVREAEARLREEAETVTVARLALFPKFTLNPGASISKVTGASDYTTKLWSIGIGAAMPILNQAQLRADFHAERARGEQAVIAYEKAVQTAYGEAENALTTLQADQARLVSLASAETGARYAFDAASRGYQSGLTDVAAMLDAERTWRAARTALTGARAQALQDAVAAFKALGGGWSPPPLENAAADPSR
ncbi:MAG TPA: efflux transporter outer membrane subunit [Caulobacteraceae bacterium]|jgi:NodT family efflux transporter outer membrane factor (OMF) lipoprotein|nr:efflux transporter outer membrane subunit [Caulobacteraceae bacterium]